jgi:hypothetical protein
MTKVLFLHGSSAGPRSIKRQRLDAQPDFVVNCPQLPFPDHRPSTKAEWAAWLIPAITAIPSAQAIAQKTADEFDPDVIVGSSLGGAIAIGVRSRAARVLIAPATSVRLKEVVIPNFFVDKTIGARVVILHAEEDEIVPFEASRQLLTSDMLRYFPGQEAMLTMIQDDLVKAGYRIISATPPKSTTAQTQTLIRSMRWCKRFGFSCRSRNDRGGSPVA